MKHEFIDHHSHGKTILHQADARVKIFIFLVIVAESFFIRTDQISRVYAILLFLGVLFVLTRIPLSHIAGKFLKIIWVPMLISVLIPFFPKGELLWQYGLIGVYQQGVDIFIRVMLKSSVMLSAILFITLTTPFNALIRGLEWYRVPAFVIDILAFMYRYLFIVIDELERLILSWRSRYIFLSSVKKARYLANISGLLFVKSIERGENIFTAMKSRGYSALVKKQKWHKIKLYDAVLIIVTLLYFTGMELWIQMY